MNSSRSSLAGHSSRRISISCPVRARDFHDERKTWLATKRGGSKADREGGAENWRAKVEEKVWRINDLDSGLYGSAGLRVRCINCSGRYNVKLIRRFFEFRRWIVWGWQSKVGREEKEEKNEERERGRDNARTSGKRTLGNSKFSLQRGIVISIQVFRMSYWPVRLSPRVDILGAASLPALSRVRCISQEVGIMSRIFYLSVVPVFLGKEDGAE